MRISKRAKNRRHRPGDSKCWHRIFWTHRRTKRGKHSRNHSSQPDGPLAPDTRPDAIPEKNQWKTRTHRLNHTCLPLSRLRRICREQRSAQHPGTQFENRERRKCTDHSPGRDAHGLASKNWHGQRKDKGISVRRKGRPKNHTSDRWTAFYRDNWMAKCMGAIFGALLRGHGQRHDASNVKHAVITGAAHGIGKALAHRFAQAGYTITGVDIDAAGAARVERELAARFVITDLRSEADIARVLPELLQKPIDVLIHNAGINAVGRFSDISIENHERVIAVNFYAPMLLTTALLKADQITKGASIAFISSLSHYTSYPGAATYAATKSGLASYARSLSIALAPQNIHVTTVFPGPTRTAHARRHSPHNTREEKRMPPETLAHHIFRGIKKKKHLIIPGATNRTLALLGKWCPPLMAYAMRKVILEKL